MNIRRAPVNSHQYFDHSALVIWSWSLVMEFCAEFEHILYCIPVGGDKLMGQADTDAGSQAVVTYRIICTVLVALGSTH